MPGENCAPGELEELHRWIHDVVGLSIPTKALCPHHQAPMDYIDAAYADEDVVVWAPRGGGKTTLGALATLIDLVRKPGCQVRILGGSLDQSLKMWEQLLPMIEQAAPEMVDGKMQAMRVRMKNGASAAVLTQSQRSVRGNRVQRVRCDEVELFSPDVWQAVQLVTRSLKAEDVKRYTESCYPGFGPTNVRASIEALSTMHQPHGLMHEIVDSAASAGRKLIRWCLLDVLEHCPDERKCDSCGLEPECHGIARNAAGFIRIDDAIAMKKRVCKETWEAEMLCLRPSRKDAVFHFFKPKEHVSEADWWRGNDRGVQRTLAIDFGYNDPFVCLWIMHDEQKRTYVLDELVSRRETLARNIDLIRQRGHVGFRMVSCDPAGNHVNSQTSWSDVDVLHSAGYEVLYKTTVVQDGIDDVNTALAPALGEPTLRVHPRCRELIRSMECYHYGPHGEKPVKDGKNDHCTDALRYFYVNRPTPTKSARY